MDRIEAGEVSNTGTNDARYVWQRCLNVSEINATGYHDNARPDLVDMLDIAPGRVLDIGCAAGGTGAYIKSRFPAAKVWGVELNRAAAEKAREKLDCVAVGKFEDVDLEALGIEPGSLDFVLIADVLEHMYDPWSTMLRIKKYLSAEGRLVISIPNIRFLPLLDDLAHGYWRYADFGILDITHIRFFTLKELQRFLHETGFSVSRLQYGLDPTLQGMFESYKAKLPCDIETDKLTLRNVDEQELHELFSGQFFLMAEPRHSELTGYAPPKMGCCFWKGEQTDYEHHLVQHRMTAHEGAAFERLIASWDIVPLIEVFALVNTQTLDNLTATIQSLSAQLHPRTRLTVLGEGAPPAALAQPGRIRWVDHHGALLDCLNQQVAKTIGEWVVVLQSGDQLLPQALLYLAEIGQRQAGLEMCYADEDVFDDRLGPSQPYFKPDISPEYLESFPYIGDGFFVRSRAWKALGGVRPELGAAAFYAMQLSVLARYGTAAFGHLADVLFRRHPVRTLCDDANGVDNLAAARRQYFDALRVAADFKPGRLPGSEQILRDGDGDVSVCLVIEVNRSVGAIRQLLDKLDQLQRGVVLRIVILLAGDLPQEEMSFLAALDEAGGETFQVFPLQPDVSPVSALNAVAQQINARYLCLFPEDGVPVEADWLQILLSTMSPGVAAVAPRMLDRSGHLQGNSLLVGCGGLAVGEGVGAKHDEPGYFGRLLSPHNPSALSLDCMLFDRELFLSVGGGDVGLVPQAAAIDLAQKFRQQGLRLVWTPFVSVIRSADDRGVVLDEHSTERLLDRWLPQLAHDPAYNPNFSRIQPFQLVEMPQLGRLGLPWHPLPRLLAFPADDMGCGHYRVIEPFNAAITAGKIDGYCSVDHYSPFDLASFSADVLLLQRQMSDSQLSFLKAYRRYARGKLIFELDDLITNVPVRSLHKAHLAKDMPKRLREALDLCDRFVVSTAPLKDAYEKYHRDIVVMPNYIDLSKWGALSPPRQTGKKPRVGWAGGVSHSGDLALVIDVVKELAGEVDWVFFGMCPDEIRPLVAEFHVGVPTLEYPAKLAALNLDLAIAPIEHNDFNLCKSNLKLLEYGALGYPVIASDFGPYQGDLPVTLVRNRFKDWVDAIRAHLADTDECARRGDALREVVRRDWSLQTHVDAWCKTWFDGYRG